ncbi:MAG: hypothetical protein HC857_11910 [Synechococcales cyanobacterium RU_4_20]|nr:hypothetical protein [Synechococcales cyanobacterium RU_4_20]
MAQEQSGNESYNTVVPLNRPAMFVLPLLQESYQLAFKPVPWLPNLRLRIWEYEERYPDGLGVLGVEPFVEQINQGLEWFPPI